MVDFDVKEESEYSTDNGLSIKQIILRHLRKIGDICCQEFTGGWWEKKPIRTSNGVMFSEYYHADVREAYCNAIDFLIDIIYPLGDKALQDYIDENEKVDAEISDIKEKLKRKKMTFREINQMFERTNFWEGSESYNE